MISSPVEIKYREEEPSVITELSTQQEAANQKAIAVRLAVKALKLFDAGDFDRAIDLMREAIVKDLYCAEYRREYARFLMRVGDLQKSNKMC